MGLSKEMKNTNAMSLFSKSLSSRQGAKTDTRQKATPHLINYARVSITDLTNFCVASTNPHLKIQFRLQILVFKMVSSGLYLGISPDLSALCHILISKSETGGEEIKVFGMWK